MPNSVDRAARALLPVLSNLLQGEASLASYAKNTRADFIVRRGNRYFRVAAESSGNTHAVAHALRRLDDPTAKSVPLVVVPFMGPTGTALCEEAGISWVDLSGNAHIVDDDLFVHVEGKTNRFKRRGRPSSAFAPKSSRVTRFLLIDPTTARMQTEIAEATGLGPGLVSKVVRRLVEDALLIRDDRKVRPRDPELLLRTWQDHYDFSRHEILRGHVASRSGETLVQELSKGLRSKNVRHAATGLAAAWLLDPFAVFRTATFYLEDHPGDDLLESLGFRESDRGASTWLVIPNDEGVFHGERVVEGVPCVHPIQAFVDLSAHPERADEAAQRIQETYLRW